MAARAAVLSEGAVVPFPVVLAEGHGQDASAGIPQPQPAQIVLLSSPLLPPQPQPRCYLLSGHWAAHEGRQGVISAAVLDPLNSAMGQMYCAALAERLWPPWTP